MSDATSRRGFLQAGGAAGVLLCTIDGKPFSEATIADVDAADKSARNLVRAQAAAKKPAGPSLDAVDRLTFGTPQPQPGGQAREYWIAARSATWNVAPSGRDQWMNRSISGRKTFRAFVYQQFDAGFANPTGPAAMPGPTLEAEVGDTIVVHLRNADTHFGQAVTFHPHGVRYTPDYDGAYYGNFTRVGGFIAPGEEFTYTFECTPDSVGVWPYHDHGPNHTLNTFRGLFGAIIVREKGATRPDVEEILYLHSLPPQVTRIQRVFQCINGRTAAGNTPTIRSKAGQDVAIHVIGGDSNFHTFHIHGHRWRNAAGAFTDCPTLGPNETITAHFREDNPGRWLYHCHVFSHQDMGMAGWYLVSPA